MSTLASNSTITSSGGAAFRNFKSPIPYLFGGLALMLGLIAIALLILSCSYRKHNSSSTLAGDDEKSTKVVDMEANSSEPKIVVIMAGECNPTYLAKPVSSTSSIEQAV